MKNSRLSLADFKAKAVNVNTNEVLEKVQGGDLSDCHGYWGQFGKKVKKGAEDALDLIFILR